MIGIPAALSVSRFGWPAVALNDDSISSATEGFVHQRSHPVPSFVSRMSAVAKASRAATGSDQTPPLKRIAPDRRAFICAAAIGWVLAGCAAAPTSRRPNIDSQEFPMTTTAAPITAEDIGRRVLKLIDSLRSAKDLAPEHIEQATGMRVEFNGDDPNIYGFGGKLTEEWSYSLVSTPDKLGEKPTSLRFSFDDTSRKQADPAPICELKFDDYSRALTESGFTAKPMQGYQGIEGWYFVRDHIGVMAYTHGKVDPAAGPACISSLAISAYA
jgi:hypothetical protein